MPPMTVVWRLRVVGDETWVADLDVHGQTSTGDERRAKEFTSRGAAQRAAIGINRRLDRPPVRVIEGRAARPSAASTACG
jgi:hypothetical protein